MEHRDLTVSVLSFHFHTQCGVWSAPLLPVLHTHHLPPMSSSYWMLCSNSCLLLHRPPQKAAGYVRWQWFEQHGSKEKVPRTPGIKIRKKTQTFRRLTICFIGSGFTKKKKGVHDLEISCHLNIFVKLTLTLSLNKVPTNKNDNTVCRFLAGSSFLHVFFPENCL